MIKHIVYIASEPERAIGLEDYLPHFHIITVKGNITESLSSLTNVHIVAIDTETISTAELLCHPKTDEIIASLSPRPEDIGIMVFKNDTRVENFCKEKHYVLLNETSALNQRFEHKLNQFQELSKLGELFPPTQIATLVNVTFTQLSEKFGLPFVMQYDRGHTGNSTLVIVDEQAFSREQEKFPNREARISKFIEGIPVTLNCCATKFGTLTSGLCIQITGLPECTSKLGTTVGNDWAAVSKFLDVAQITEIERISAVVGDYLYSQNFKGMFGLDLIVTSGRVYLIEVNARQTASVGLHTKLLLERKQLPLVLFHIAEFIGEENTNFFEPQFSTASSQVESLHITKEAPFEASQLIVRNTEQAPVKSGLLFTTGVYNKSIKLSSDYNFRNVRESDFLVLVAPKERALEPEDEVFRIIRKGGALQSPNELLLELKEAVRMLKTSIVTSTQNG